MTELSINHSLPIQISVVDAMWLVRMCSIKDTNATIFCFWEKKSSSYIHSFSGENLYIVLGSHTFPNESTKVLSKRTLIDFLTNEWIKEEPCNLIAKYFISDKMVIGWKLCQLYQVGLLA